MDMSAGELTFLGRSSSPLLWMEDSQRLYSGKLHLTVVHELSPRDAAAKSNIRGVSDVGQ